MRMDENTTFVILVALMLFSGLVAYGIDSWHKAHQDPVAQRIAALKELNITADANTIQKMIQQITENTK